MDSKASHPITEPASVPVLKPTRKVLSAPIIPKPGTRLMREWRGRVHEVVIETDGVSLDGVKLKSLTEAAKRITGVHWSGPRFFGLVARSDGS